MLVYDQQENLAEFQRPIYLTPAGGILVCVCDVGLGGWKTAREVMEILQLAKPTKSEETVNLTNLDDIRKVVGEMQSTTNIIEELRKDNSSALDHSQKVEGHIRELERTLNSYGNRLRTLLWPTTE